MKYVQVYINDELIDLVPGQAVAMTYQLNDIADIKNQRANFSNVFKAARSKGNDRKLGFGADINSTDKRPYRLLPARIIIDGEDIVTNGYATIKKTDKYYNVLVYSGLLDLYAKLGELKLKDIDLSEFDHALDLATIQSLLPTSTGICYPLIDYGHLVVRNACLLDYMRFSIYIKEIIERILTNAGFEFSGSFFNHAHYDKLLLPFTNEKLTNKASSTAGSFEATNEAGYPVANTNVFTDVGGFTVTKGNSANCFNGTTYTVGAYAVRGKFTFEGSISDAFGGTQKTALRLISSTKGILTYAKQDILGTSVNVKLTVNNVDYEAGEVIKLQVQHNNAAGITVQGKVKFVQDTIVPYNGLMPVAENLPDIKQKDFLKGIAQIYGLIFDIDVQTQNVRIRFFDDIIANKAAAKDWSWKLDLKVQDEKTYDLGLAQVNNFSYNNGTEEGEEDTDAAEAGNVPFSLGRGVILADNDTLKEEDEAVALPFAATEELVNDEVDGANNAVTLPYIKIYSPTNKVAELTVGAGGTNETQVPYYYSSTSYGAPPAYDAGTIYGGQKRVRYNGAVWEWQSNESGSSKEPGVALDTGDNGTNYVGLPYWKLIPIEDTFIFKQNVKVKPRILLAEEHNQSIFFQGEQHGGDFTENNLIVPVFLGALDFETRIAANYKVLQDTANDTKLLRAYFTLWPDDIKTLDFLQPVFVGYYSNFFYISRIDKYQQGQSTPVDLVKI